LSRATCSAQSSHRFAKKNGYAMEINDITYAIRGAVFEVNRILGSGFLEKVYENALIFELRDRGLKAENQVPLKVFYKENLVGDYLADIFVEDQVIVELKAVEKLEKIHEAQLLNYLRATGIRVGLLVNMKHPKAEIKRMVMDLPEGPDG
jgi:GxxExxY protein